MTDHCCKIGRTIDKYNLQESVIGGELNKNLKARWLGQNEFPETATRPLTNWFNQKILKTVYAEHDRRAIETQLESDLEALQSDDEVTQGAIVDDLADDGIDGEELLDDFAKRSTMYRHLTQCLEAEKNTDSDSDSNWEEDKIEYARETMQKNIADVLRSLERKGELPNGTEAEIQTPIILTCPECSTQTRFSRAKKRGYICADHSNADSDIRTDGASDDDDIAETKTAPKSS
jgi:rubrerythrin